MPSQKGLQNSHDVCGSAGASPSQFACLRTTSSDHRKSGSDLVTSGATITEFRGECSRLRENLNGDNQLSSAIGDP